VRCKSPAFWKIHDEPRKAVPCSDLNDNQNAIGNAWLGSKGGALSAM
jgi:hypothetical protein